MTAWKECNISELCSDIIDCVNKTAPLSPTETPYRMLRTSDVRNGYINTENLNCVSKEVFEKWTRRGKLQIGDIVFTREAPLGEAGIVREAENYFLGQRLVLYRVNPEVCDPRFLLYWFLNPMNKEALKKRGIGSTVTHLRVPECMRLKVTVPDIAVQTRIADILWAFDSLICSNEKQIKLLEEAARRLYREWFVDLRFPGHEHVQIVDGVPEGWSTVRVADCLQYHINGGWGKETPIGKNVHPARVIRGTDINDIKMGDFAELPLRFHTQNDIEKRILKGNDLVFELSNGNINNIGRSLFVDDLILAKCGENTICASFCKLFRPKNKMYSLMLYWEIQHMQSSGEMFLYKKQGSNGINNFAFDSFLEHQFLIPNQESLWMPFECIMRKITNAQRQLTILKEARDRLLPRLMSGEIEL